MERQEGLTACPACGIAASPRYQPGWLRKGRRFLRAGMHCPPECTCQAHLPGSAPSQSLTPASEGASSEMGASCIAISQAPFSQDIQDATRLTVTRWDIHERPQLQCCSWWEAKGFIKDPCTHGYSPEGTRSTPAHGATPHRLRPHAPAQSCLHPSGAAAEQRQQQFLQTPSSCWSPAKMLGDCC